MFKSVLHRGGVPRIEKLLHPHPPTHPWWEARAITCSLFSKPVLSQNVDVHAVPAYRTSTFLVSAFPAHSASFSPNSSKSSTVTCVLKSIESELLLVAGIQSFCFALISRQLPVGKTSSIYRSIKVLGKNRNTNSVSRPKYVESSGAYYTP